MVGVRTGSVAVPFHLLTFLSYFHFISFTYMFCLCIHLCAPFLRASFEQSSAVKSFDEFSNNVLLAGR